jgi:hypothetical protein
MRYPRDERKILERADVVILSKGSSFAWQA